MNFGWIITALLFCLILGILVFFHELGHFLAAKLFKMRVLEFAFNIGPKLVTLFHDGQTEYTVRAVPLGGFVRIAGMEIEDEFEGRLTGTAYEKGKDADKSDKTEADTPGDVVVAPVHDPDGYNSRPVWQRFIVILAGPVFSFLLGWLTLCLIGVTVGYPKLEPGTKLQLGIGDVTAGSVAKEAGLKAGDIILTINGQTIERFDKGMEIIRSSAGEELVLDVQSKNKSTRQVTVIPRPEKDESTGETVGRLGFIVEPVPATPPKLERVSLAESFRVGNERTVFWFRTITQLFASGEKIASSVGGPVAIFKETANAAQYGGYGSMLLLGQLSLSLGLFNLFPIPILDGGHLALLTLEAIRGRKLTTNQMATVQLTGLAILAVIFVLVMFKDVRNLFPG